MERISGLDQGFERLAASRNRWPRRTAPDRARLLRAAARALGDVAESWVEEACRQRGIDPRSALAGEEWLSGPMTLARHLRLYAEALAAEGRPRLPALRRRPDGQWIVDVFPTGTLDRLLYRGMRAEVRILPGREPTQGGVYRRKQRAAPPTGGVGLVLGAGNISSIAPLDALHKLVVDDQVVLLKLSPVNDYLKPFLERALAPLLAEGVLEIVTGDAALGEALCHDPRVESIHLTGSERTFESLVWGHDAGERERRKADRRPRVDKPLTAELGCVTPILVVPGRWSARDLEFQARHVSAMVAHNAGFNCTSGRLLVLARGWSQREEFLHALRHALGAMGPRRAYYPGAEERHAELRGRYPQAVVLGRRGEAVVPWTFIPDVPPAEDEFVMRHEAWCGTLAETSLPAADAAEFLERAVAFVNERVWGTLSCVVLVDEITGRAAAEDVERAVDRLRYGDVAINAWSGVLFALGSPAWGAFPGHTRQAIGSGMGFVHNTYLLDHPQKSVLRAPFRPWPKPVWFADHRTLRQLGRHLTFFETTRSPLRLGAVVRHGLRG